jgi:hypothetical protein
MLCQPSSKAIVTRGSNRPVALVCAPRPRRRSSATGGVTGMPAGPGCDMSGSGGRRLSDVGELDINPM